MSLRRLFATAAALAVCAAASLAAAGTAAAEAYVLRGSYSEQVSGSFYNICDMSQGPDSPMFTASGRYQQSFSVVQVDELHFVVSAHAMLQMTGSYPDGRNVSVHNGFNISETINVDPDALANDELVLNSALVATSTQRELIQVAGRDGAPDQRYTGTVHLTFTPNLEIASIVVEYRGGC